MRCHRKIGFTLIQLVVTCVIAGALMALALVNYHKTILAQIERQAIVQLQTIYAANNIHLTKNGAYLNGINLDRVAINAGLDLTIPDSDILYTYTTDAAYDYFVFAQYQDNGVTAFELRLVGCEPLISLKENDAPGSFVGKAYAQTTKFNPCCNAGPCFIAPACDY